MMAPIFSTYGVLKEGGESWSKADSINYNLWARTAFGLGVGWCIFSAETAFGGRFLIIFFFFYCLLKIQFLDKTYISMDLICKLMTGYPGQIMKYRGWIPVSRLTYIAMLMTPIFTFRNIYVQPFPVIINPNNIVSTMTSLSRSNCLSYQDGFIRSVVPVFYLDRYRLLSTLITSSN